VLLKKTWESDLVPGYEEMDHPNVLKVMGAGSASLIKLDGTKTSPRYFTVTDFCENGELFDFVSAAKGLNSSMTRRFFLQCVHAVNYVHRKGFAHRDLKMENFFLDADYYVKLADFGLCKKTIDINGQKKLLRTYCGSETYIAPEMRGHVSEELYDGQKADVFSLGVILYIMLTGLLPFRKALDNHYQEFMNDPIAHLESYGKKLEPAVIELLMGMLEQDPAKRMNISEVLTHRWLGYGCATRADVQSLVKSN
jgi:serine/threonine protein kinase